MAEEIAEVKGATGKRVEIKGVEMNRTERNAPHSAIGGSAEDEEIECPYKEGVMLSLTLQMSESSETTEYQSILCKILKLYEPQTLSCVMEVELMGGHLGNKHAVLKLYDRKFATQLRSDYKVGPLTYMKEERFRAFVESGGASKFVERLRTDDEFEEPEEGWNMAENEAYLHNYCAKMYETETATYKLLKEHQGGEIPQLFAQVRTEQDASTRVDSSELFEVKGILLELIHGYPLSDLVQRAPKEEWGSICQEAVNVVKMLNKYPFRNEDTRPANMMVTSSLPAGKRRIVAIDFGRCMFWNLQEYSPEEWLRAKWRQDEEGAIGYIMQRRLRNVPYEWAFKHSWQFLDWAPGEDDP